MTKITGYKLIRSGIYDVGFDKFEESIKHHIKDGFQPSGAPFSAGSYICQAMVMYSDTIQDTETKDTTPETKQTDIEIDLNDLI